MTAMCTFNTAWDDRYLRPCSVQSFSASEQRPRPFVPRIADIFTILVRESESPQTEKCVARIIDNRNRGING